MKQYFLNLSAHQTLNIIKTYHIVVIFCSYSTYIFYPDHESLNRLVYMIFFKMCRVMYLTFNTKNYCFFCLFPILN